jgi:hypothetical protein
VIDQNATCPPFRQAAHLGLLLAFSLSIIPGGAAQELSQVDLSRMDVEDLMNIKVTSVSKREQSLAIGRACRNGLPRGFLFQEWVFGR